MHRNDTSTFVTDITIESYTPTDPYLPDTPKPWKWHRIEKDLLLHTVEQSAWLYLETKTQKDLAPDEPLVTDIKIGEQPPNDTSNNWWESRPGGIWLQKKKFDRIDERTVTDVTVLFGEDAADPRPDWTLLQEPLLLHVEPEVPRARLSVRRGEAKPMSNHQRPILRAKPDKNFKILQVSDMHMVTGVGTCRDALGAHGQPLPESEADPLTIRLMEKILDIEKPDLVILTGDQLDEDNVDTETAILKLIAPLIERSIPYAAVFGNHDDEGPWTSSRVSQMSFLQKLPLSLCQQGPAQVDGVGNYYIQVLSDDVLQSPLLTLYLLDSHGQAPTKVKNPDYGWIKQSQIDWFMSTSRTLRMSREGSQFSNHSTHLSLAFMHIPFPEYADRRLVISGGHRGEPTEGPSFNSRFYDALAEEGVAAVGCGHDHVNDFCALRRVRQTKNPQHIVDEQELQGPWLCYAGSVGFGGYGSYDGKRYHRRARIWDIDVQIGNIRSWKRVEYATEKVDEIILVDHGKIVATARVPDETVINAPRCQY
ncbi:MAG: purple acid phosphatase [Bogoriella megaspora]|nr:MAG: purple acid phosphatase [Bogoriella megaspora]